MTPDELTAAECLSHGFPRPLKPNALLAFAGKNCTHCKHQLLALSTFPPRLRCAILRNLIHAADLEMPVPLPARLFLHPDIDLALTQQGEILPAACPPLAGYITSYPPPDAGYITSHPEENPKKTP